MISARYLCPLLLLLSLHLFGQQDAAFRIERLGPKDGLSHRWTQCVHQDKKGYIWIGTYDGLNRYDGNEFIVYRPSAGGKFPIQADLIYKIIEDVNGKFYLESRYGLLKFDPDSEKFELIDEVKKDNSILIYTTNYPGQFIASLYNYGIVKGNYFSIYELNNSGKLILRSKFNINIEVPFSTLPVSCDKDRIWFWDFTGNYLRLDIKTNNWVKIQIPGSKEIPLDKNGKFHFPEADHLSSLSFPEQIKNGKSFYIETGKAIWIYAEKDHIYTLYRYDLKTKKLKITFPNIPEANINFLNHQVMSPSFYLDRESTFWCGGFLGLSKIRGIDNLFKNIMAIPVKSLDAPPSGTSIRSITEDAFGNIYFIGNYSSSLNKLSTKTGILKQIKLPLITSGNPYYQDYYKNGVAPAFSLLSDNEASIWVTSILGLFKYNTQTEKFQYYNTFSETLPYLIGNYHGKLLYWQFGKIFLLDKKSGKFISGPELLLGEYQIPLLLEKENILWAITDTGLIKFSLPDFKSQKIKLFNEPRELRCIIFHKGFLWIGTARGLEKVNPTTFEHTNYDRSKGLPGNFVYSLVGDGDYLWLGTSDGLCRFSVSTGAVKNFYVEDGLSHNEFNTLSAYKARNGMIYMGGLNGINAFYPKDLEGKSTIKSNVLLSRFSLFDTNKDSLIYLNTSTISDKIRLSPSETSFNIHLALNNYIDPGKNQFAWKLEGLDQDWFYAGNQHVANYRYVPPGQYTFRAKAADSFGNWTEQELVLKLIVMGPWYNRWWAWLIYIILIGGAALMLYRFQLSKKLDHAENLRLQSLDEFKNRFFTNITHEFRTPLTVILGMSGKLEEENKLTDKASDKKNSAVSLIKRNAESLLRLINQILDLAKLESNSLKLNYIQADVMPYLRYIIESLQSFANTQNILLRIQSKESGIIMDYDPERLLQIVHNLVSNAIKFTPNGGKVSLQIAIELSASKSHKSLRLVVEDTGAGIPQEDLKNIFDRFYQANNLEKAKSGGTGIGLSLTKELVQAMGGNINVESEIGKGTKFIVSLPITNNADKPESQDLSQINYTIESSSSPIALQPQASSIANAHDPRILIIEDNPDVVEYLASCLESNYQLDFAYNGRSGIEKALETSPDFILSDVMMPEKDGFEVCDFLKNDERTSHIPIILLTAKADVESRLAGLRKGADAYLAKPFHKEELLVHIQNLLGLRRKLQSKYAKTALEGSTSQIAENNINEVEATENEFLQRLRTIVEENLSDSNMDVDAICKKIGMGRTNLHNKLSALTGLSTTIYVRKLRLQRAKQLLTTTDMNVSEVAYEVGFNDPKFFSRVFVEEFGVPPSKIN